MVLRGGLQEFRNCLIVGASAPRAIERLDAVKHELETNPYPTELFGGLRGDVEAKDGNLQVWR